MRWLYEDETNGRQCRIRLNIDKGTVNSCSCTWTRTRCEGIIAQASGRCKRRRDGAQDDFVPQAFQLCRTFKYKALHIPRSSPSPSHPTQSQNTPTTSSPLPSNAKERKEVGNRLDPRFNVGEFFVTPFDQADVEQQDGVAGFTCTGELNIALSPPMRRYGKSMSMKDGKRQRQ
ncbi:uncharacterized protein MYCFIDRAFT_173950 [Pseudocercospora fijiensis CIRAD86]|uniref:Uncharacterized protein n=1 Tax=Pseudocercospora fijiensis (strain CIRAD86) TaxID=383855 RepID=M3AKH4_PSEFD|nr:uncharacterized protein MYCFIDRAFT_173950 [Pseudocercospora fijiensis CIRAD86]EME85086.1 hypothetical protein MYCFIDRAFT_173950 [Pseudocercospora fijiensis CIRAD86]